VTGSADEKNADEVSWSYVSVVASLGYKMVGDSRLRACKVCRRRDAVKTKVRRGSEFLYFCGVGENI
jgi:hypothetical protein